MTAKHIIQAVALALAFAGTAASAHGEKAAARQAFDPAAIEKTAFDRAGNPAYIARTIKVGMSDAIRLTPSNVTLKPCLPGGIVWQFNQPGEYSLACMLPGHLEAGMTGKVVIQ